jgi:hypothetical protein
VVDRYGDTPLHFAAREGSAYRLMELFVQASAEAISVQNGRGVTPFWSLPRSFLKATSLQEILNGVRGDDDDDDDASHDDDCDAGDYADDWNLMVLFLRYARGEDVPRADTFSPHPSYDWLVAAAAATPACPRQVLRFLCQLFPEQALQYDALSGGIYTPLHLACQAPEMVEPTTWDETDDYFRDHVEVAPGILQIEDHAVPETRTVVGGGDAEFIHQVTAATVDDSAPSVVEILLEWSPRSASIPDRKNGRLPLGHALVSGKSWIVIRHLMAACPSALESIDPETGMYMFQLAAMHAPELDSVYSIVRSFPILLNSYQYDRSKAEESPRKRFKRGRQ